MQLLVSVANPIEACHAVNGGADLIDAKDPLNGALGAVSLFTLRDIHAVVSGRRVVTAALGDANDADTIERRAFEYGAAGVGFVKVGFAGLTDAKRVTELVAATVRGVRATGRRSCGVVGVAYADTSASSVDFPMLVTIAARTGAQGVLIDTALKNGPGLVDLVSSALLRSWVAMAHDARLTVALAGRLTADDLPWALDTGADIVGVRGAACEGGRTGRVVQERVSLLRSRLLQPPTHAARSRKTRNLQGFHD
jgi:uncharacterized protein (UPF0264 family)